MNKDDFAMKVLIGLGRILQIPQGLALQQCRNHVLLVHQMYEDGFSHQETLDELVSNLKLNPELVIQLGSHTDCRGPARYNQDLSQKRAQSAVDYLIEKGISPERLSAKGYGENELAVECICARCSEEEHQENRRTTFTILDAN